MVAGNVASMTLGIEIRRLLENEMGEAGVLIYKKQCWDLGLNPERIGLNDVQLIARGVSRATSPILGQDRSKALEKRIIRFKIIQELKELSKELDPVSKARKGVNLALSLGDICRTLKEYDDAKKYYRQAARDANTASLPVMEARAYRGTAHVHREQSELEDAKRWFKKAADLSKTIGDNIGMIDAWRGMGKVYWSLGKFNDAYDVYKDALDLAEKLKDNELLGIMLIDIGNVYNERGELDDAENHYLRAIPLLEEKKNYEELSRAYNNIGDLMLQRKEWKKSIDYFQKSKEEGERILSDKMTGWAIFNMAEAQMNLGDVEKAHENITKALALLRVVDDKRGIFAALKILGEVYAKKKDWEKADEAFAESLEYAKKTHSPQEVARAYLFWASSKLAQGKKNNAREYLQSAEKLLGDVAVPELNEKMRDIKEKL